MVVDSDGEQDVATTMSLLEGFLLLVHKRFPHIKKIVLISDNGRFYFPLPFTFISLLLLTLPVGSHFASMTMLLHMAAFNARMRDQNSDFRVAEWHFSEPQWGKSILDTHFRLEVMLLQRAKSANLYLF